MIVGIIDVIIGTWCIAWTELERTHSQWATNTEQQTHCKAHCSGTTFQ